MDNQTLVQTIIKLVSRLLATKSVELIDVELKGTIGNQVLRIYVDVEGGITLRQCTDLNRDIADLLDTEDLMPGKYRLEVSSPGVYRPLKTSNDFRRNIGRAITISLLDDQLIEGTIEKVEDNDIYIKGETSLITLLLSNIKNAKLKLKW
jgi:ribosome maturation factor RimP